MVCGSLDGKTDWGRMDTYKCMAESLCCLPETITILLITIVNWLYTNTSFLFFFNVEIQNTQDGTFSSTRMRSVSTGSGWGSVQGCAVYALYEEGSTPLKSKCYLLNVSASAPHLHTSVITSIDDNSMISLMPGLLLTVLDSPFCSLACLIL